MFFLKYSTSFKKDLKAFRPDRGLLLVLEKVLDILVSGRPLPEEYRDHHLRGEFKDCSECHLKPDVLLIYKKDGRELCLLLLRIGSHSDFF